MKLHRFYVDETIGSTGDFKLVSPTLLKQFFKVLRLHAGETVILFDNSGFDYEGIIGESANDFLIINITKKIKNNVHPKREVYLFSSIVKKDTFEWIAQKATELGIAQLIPMLSTRSEKKDLNVDRLWKIMIEAAEQSGRATLPTITSIMDLRESLDYLKKTLPNVSPVVFHTEAEPFHTDAEPLHSFLHTTASTPVAVFIGPEGGWAPEEIILFKENKIPIHSLGPQILRAETAVVAALSKVVFLT